VTLLCLSPKVETLSVTECARSCDAAAAYDTDALRLLLADSSRAPAQWNLRVELHHLAECDVCNNEGQVTGEFCDACLRAMCADCSRDGDACVACPLARVCQHCAADGWADGYVRHGGNYQPLYVTNYLCRRCKQPPRRATPPPWQPPVDPFFRPEQRARYPW